MMVPNVFIFFSCVAGWAYVLWLLFVDFPADNRANSQLELASLSDEIAGAIFDGEVPDRREFSDLAILAKAAIESVEQVGLAVLLANLLSTPRATLDAELSSEVPLGLSQAQADALRSWRERYYKITIGIMWNGSVGIAVVFAALGVFERLQGLPKANAVAAARHRWIDLLSMPTNRSVRHGSRHAV